MSKNLTLRLMKIHVRTIFVLLIQLVLLFILGLCIIHIDIPLILLNLLAISSILLLMMFFYNKEKSYSHILIRYINNDKLNKDKLIHESDNCTLIKLFENSDVLNEDDKLLIKDELYKRKLILNISVNNKAMFIAKDGKAIALPYKVYLAECFIMMKTRSPFFSDRIILDSNIGRINIKKIQNFYTSFIKTEVFCINVGKEEILVKVFNIEPWIKHVRKKYI